MFLYISFLGYFRTSMIQGGGGGGGGNFLESLKTELLTNLLAWYLKLIDLVREFQIIFAFYPPIDMTSYMTSYMTSLMIMTS